MKKLAFIAALAVTSQAFVACGGSDSTQAQVVIPPAPPPAPPLPPPPPPPPPPVGQASDFGAGFAAAFAASPDAEPVDPVAGDTIPVTKFADPLDIPNP